MFQDVLDNCETSPLETFRAQARTTVRGWATFTPFYLILNFGFLKYSNCWGLFFQSFLIFKKIFLKVDNTFCMYKMRFFDDEKGTLQKVGGEDSKVQFKTIDIMRIDSHIAKLRFRF